MRKLILTLTLALVVTLTVSTPALAFGELNADVNVAPTATVKKHGTSVAWDVSFICPRGEAYTLDATVMSLDEFSDPSGIARLSTTGKCNGKVQSRTLHLTTVTSEPVTPGAPSQAQVIIRNTTSNDSFFAGWASGPDNCCEDDGPRIILVKR